MSDMHDPPMSGPAGLPPLTVVPVRYPPPPRSSPFRWVVRFFFSILLFASILFNFILLAQVPGCGDSGGSIQVEERFLSGQRLAEDKIAIVNIDGVLMEGMTGFARKEIERAARDDHVKAVVVRINSPGGSITASDDLHRRITELRDGLTVADMQTPPKPVIVSMGSMAASGGYYIAMPAKTVLAERTSITGSIGVYAAFPNVAELSNKVGFKMDLIKAGVVKDSGSAFRDMTPHEREVWEYMVDTAYIQFLQVVEQGRPQLKGKLQEDITIDETLSVRTEKGRTKELNFTRYRADGGVFTAQEAKKYGLIDQIGYLEDAVQVAKRAAGLAETYKVVSYERPASLLGLLSGTEGQSEMRLEPGRLAASVVPRLWYLAPQCELSGLLRAAGGN